MASHRLARERWRCLARRRSCGQAIGTPTAEWSCWSEILWPVSTAATCARVRMKCAEKTSLVYKSSQCPRKAGRCPRKAGRYRWATQGEQQSQTFLNHKIFHETNHNRNPQTNHSHNQSQIPYPYFNPRIIYRESMKKNEEEGLL